jgi:hypothetical protein
MKKLSVAVTTKSKPIHDLGHRVEGVVFPARSEEEPVPAPEVNHVRNLAVAGRLEERE